jgi:uncharacterized protein YciI
MKSAMISLILIVSYEIGAQIIFPDFLAGTWKTENKEIYERWDQLNQNNLKGISYLLKDGQMIITEYLDISRNDHDIIYTANVLNQNNGEGISFRLSLSDSTYIFENPDHDFPTKIMYQKLSDTELNVQVSDGNDRSFAYRLKKHIAIETQKDTSSENPNYNAVLAQRLGADDYGMKSYILVLLKTGLNQTTDKHFISQCFRGHLDNINRLVKDEKLVVAGPLGKNKNSYRGLFILSVSDLDEAEILLQTDPAIREGLLDVELYNWYGSAALPEYLEFSDMIWKLKP